MPLLGWCPHGDLLEGPSNYASSLTEQEQENVAAAVAEPPSEPLAEVSQHPFTGVMPDGGWGDARWGPGWCPLGTCEKVLPLYASSLTEEDEEDVAAAVAEPPSEPLAKVGQHPFTGVMLYGDVLEGSSILCIQLDKSVYS